jgi:hypothetical protein
MSKQSSGPLTSTSLPQKTILKNDAGNKESKIDQIYNEQ